MNSVQQHAVFKVVFLVAFLATYTLTSKTWASYHCDDLDIVSDRFTRTSKYTGKLVFEITNIGHMTCSGAEVEYEITNYMKRGELIRRVKATRLKVRPGETKIVSLRLNFSGLPPEDASWSISIMYQGEQLMQFAGYLEE